MMHPYGAVDFVDNSLSSSVGAAAGAVGYPALGASYPGAAVAGAGCLVGSRLMYAG